MNFASAEFRREPVAVVTEMLVDADDPAFRDPTKPIGSHMDEATREETCRRAGLDGEGRRGAGLAARGALARGQRKSSIISPSSTWRAPASS